VCLMEPPKKCLMDIQSIT